MARGLLFVVSGPSGTGKTTLVKRLVGVVPNLMMSRSYTSRPARPDESDGMDYNFIRRDQVQAMVARSEFLECAEVFGNFYGTSAADTEHHLGEGRDLVLVIDVHGARQVRGRGVGAIELFVLPPSFAVLERRLRGRSGDHHTEPQIRRRLEVAREEVLACSEYDYVVVNDELETCVDRLRGIVLAERARLHAAAPMTDTIIETFRKDGAPRTGRT